MGIFSPDENGWVRPEELDENDCSRLLQKLLCRRYACLCNLCPMYNSDKAVCILVDLMDSTEEQIEKMKARIRRAL